MPFAVIEVPSPTYATPQLKIDADLWIPKGVKVQWGGSQPDPLDSGECGVGIGVGNFTEGPAAEKRYAEGRTSHEDMMMLWFNRTQINEVIKILRRARTATYGSDE